MKLVVFGLSVSSAWGNGHATLWRGLCRALRDMEHQVVFFERDTPYYAAHRDMPHPPGCDLHLYADWSDVALTAHQALQHADAAILTSYCPDAQAAADLMLACGVMSCFYDLDAPITLARTWRGERVEYMPRQGLGPFDLVLSYTGGRSLPALAATFGARTAYPLYGSVDTRIHHRSPPRAALLAHASYLGTYARDRHPTLDALFVTPAHVLKDRRFLLAGALYPPDVDWPDNLRRMEHVPPPDHAAFYSSCNLTVNVTRAAMARMGHCPSGRLFEAAACATPILSDTWEGIERFFVPGREIMLARSTDQALCWMSAHPDTLAQLGEAARLRALREHTSEMRATELLEMLAGVA